MAGFSEVLIAQQGGIESLAEIPESAHSLDALVEMAEKNQGLGVDEAASLIAWGRDPARRGEIHAAASCARERLAPHTVEFIIPVYLTSFCQNECLYCGYRKSNPIAERIRLELEDFDKQLELICSWGHRQIELVLSDDPEFGPDLLARYVESTRRKLDAMGGGVVALCSPVYEQRDYARLRAAGLDWVVEWQETYHQPHFDRWHFVGSRKRHFESRLDIWDNTIAAGIRKVGLGALLGLYDWRFDVLATVEHGNYLRRTYGIEPHALGIPRLKPARGVLASQKPSRFSVSDDDFRLILDVYHLAFPHSRLFFNTRESYEFNLSMVAPGDLFTVDCETLPGGYLRRHLPGQFSTHDYPDRWKVVETLAGRGLSSRYLECETAVTTTETSAPEAVDVDLKGWVEEHQQVRAGLENWRAILAWLGVHRGEDPVERQAALSALRMVLYFFKTFVITHCRNEEGVLYHAFGLQVPEASGQIQRLRAQHERLGVDLDKFERQLVSYSLSGDPSVLLSIGDRVVRELEQHLEEEESFARNESGSRPADLPRASLPATR